MQVKEGEGDWTDWLTGATAVKATFAGMQGLSYTFQVRAIDNVSNEGDWVESDVVEIATVTKYYAFAWPRPPSPAFFFLPSAYSVVHFRRYHNRDQPCRVG